MTDSILRSYYNVSSSMFVPFAVTVVTPAIDRASTLLTAETDGFAIFAENYDTVTAAAYVGGPVGGTVSVKDTGTPANNLTDVCLDNSNLIQSGTSPKMVTFSTSPYVRWSPHNLVIRSESLDNAAWTTNQTTVTANNTTSPDGALTAELVTHTNTAAYLTLTTTFTSLANTTYTASCYVKQSSGTWFGLEVSDFATQGFSGWFDLTNGVVGSTASSGAATVTSSSIISVGSGWYRVAVTGQLTATIMTPVFRITTADAVVTTSNGNAAWIWGAQVNRGPIASPYLVTVASSRVGIPQSYDTAAAKYAVLIEPAATNLIVRSEALDNASWTVNDLTVTANNTTAPDGSTTAELLTNGTGGTSNINQTGLSLTSGTFYTFSIFLKRNNNDWVELFFSDNTNRLRAWFNLNTGVVGSTSTTGTGASVTSSIAAIGNSWYRCTVSGNPGTTASFFAGLLNATADLSTASTNSGTLYAWGAQAETGTVASSYIPTAAITSTRSTDQVNTPTSTVPAFPTELSLYGSGKNLNVNFTVSNEYALISVTGTTTSLYAEHSGVTQASFSLGTATNGAACKIAGRFKANDFHGALNGTLAASPDTSGTMPAPTFFRLGYDHGAPASNIEYIYQSVAVPRIYSNSELQSKTA